ncbi:hypothetical protein HDU76_005841 [Blyttiomyces sp. JEL0837]|nr:hypothetical protein HDU76_005841 [Blyttiomyces sp. JEL0837]
MCIIFFTFSANPDSPYKLDEFIARPTQQAEFWDLAPHILAGRDLGHFTQRRFLSIEDPPTSSSPNPSSSTPQPTSPSFSKTASKLANLSKAKLGTWIGITKTGRFSFLTNYREDPKTASDNAESRGHLVRDFLLDTLDQVSSSNPSATTFSSLPPSSLSISDQDDNGQPQQQEEGEEEDIGLEVTEHGGGIIKTSSNVNTNSNTKQTSIQQNSCQNKNCTPESHMLHLSKNCFKYNGFNLVVGDIQSGQVMYLSNRNRHDQSIPSSSSLSKNQPVYEQEHEQEEQEEEQDPSDLENLESPVVEQEAGVPFMLKSDTVYGLCNSTLRGGESWPKVARGKGKFEDLVETLRSDPEDGGGFDVDNVVEEMLEILRDKTPVPDSDLPLGMYNYDIERLCAPICIDQERSLNGYGTRTHTIIIIDRFDRVKFVEVDRYVSVPIFEGNGGGGKGKEDTGRKYEFRFEEQRREFDFELVDFGDGGDGEIVGNGGEDEMDQC